MVVKLHYRNLSLLTLCQLISATGSIVFVTLGGIFGTALASNASFATFPVSIMVVSVAITAIPASMFMKRFGRKTGFALASLAAVTAMLVAAWSLQQQSFPLLIVAAALLGINMSFTQQYRYAAAESVEPRFIGRAISLVLVGAIGGAFVGPELVSRGQSWVVDVPYAGTLIAVSVLYLVQFCLLLSLAPFRAEQTGKLAATPRRMRDVARQQVFLVSVFSGTAAYAGMSFIMTATPISMHIHDGYSIVETANVIRGHVLGMYVPSLVSGFLLDRFGATRVMSVGSASLLVACTVGWYDHSYLHYWVALVLLGVGWNFLFVGATTSLTKTYTQSERFKSQAVNEFCVFGSAGAASLLAGTILHLYGWKVLILLPVPVLLLVIVGLYLVRNDPLLQRRRPEEIAIDAI